MNDDQLELLLRNADAAICIPPGPDNLAARVRRRAQRQRQMRLAAGAASALLVLVIGTVALVKGFDRPAPRGKMTIADTRPAPADVAQLQARVEQLREEILAECRATDEILRRQEVERRLADLQVQAAVDPLEEVSDQMDRAALTMVYQADRMCRELNLRESAITSYEQTIRLFPQTHWAKVAKDRLAELKAAGKGDST